jgi:NADPH:quinone reductase-like Zn-dependent oxidoreductase
LKAAFVTGPDQTPTYGDFADPGPEAGYELITVTASALSPAAKAMAAGSFYGTAGAYPKVVGIDGTGRTEGGQRVYFTMPQAPFGAMAEKVLAPAGNCVALPDGLDDVTAAALANPGLSSVAALTARAALRPGETVLVHGATGAAGTLAVQLARHLGAGKVIAAGRDATALERAAALGADVTISLLGEAGTTAAALAEQFGGDGVDVVLDYLYGRRAETLLAAIGRTRGISRPVRYVVVGGADAQEITLPSMVLRAAPVTVMGSGLGSAPFTAFTSAVGVVLRAAIPERLHIDTTTVPLAEVSRAWNTSTGRSRAVFVTDPAARAAGAAAPAS